MFLVRPVRRYFAQNIRAKFEFIVYSTSFVRKSFLLVCTRNMFAAEFVDGDDSGGDKWTGEIVVTLFSFAPRKSEP